MLGHPPGTRWLTGRTQNSSQHGDQGGGGVRKMGFHAISPQQSNFSPAHPFAYLHIWVACCNHCKKLGMNWEERILWLHWMHAHRGFFMFWCYFLGQCTLKLRTLT